MVKQWPKRTKHKREEVVGDGGSLLYRSQSDPGILPLLQNITGEIAGEKRDKSPIVPIYVTNY